MPSRSQIGRRDQRQLRPAWRTQAVAADRLAAGRAKSRQGSVQGAAEKRAERRGKARPARRVEVPVGQALLKVGKKLRK